MTYKAKHILFLLFLFIGISAFAQDLLKFRVVDFRYDAFDQTARDESFKKYDGSGFLYAIVKLKGATPDDDMRDYNFNFGNMNHIVENHNGEIWLYVQKNAKIVTITRSGYVQVSHYDLKTTIESGKTYSMTLSAQGPVIYTQMVMFSIKPADSKAIVTITKEDSQSREPFGMIDENGKVAKNLEYGTYTYEVMAENYYPSEGRITLNNQDETHIEKVTLRTNGAKVTLDAGTNADIYVNGNKRGTSKWTGVLKAGKYTVECRLPNHKPSQQTISIEEGKDKIIQLTPPTPITGTLSLNSRPLGANIRIDGKDYGTTPRNIRDLLIGKHSIALSMSGYATKTEECNIRENETLSLEMTLDKSSEADATQSGSLDGDKTFTVGNVSFIMKPVAGGTFVMGATAEQGKDAYKNEKPIHRVTLSDFYIGETEVTQELWLAVMGSNPFKFKGSEYPAHDVSWNDSQEFVQRLSVMTGQKFRLPTEAEWEYAARGGKNSKGYKYSGSNNIEDVAWYNKNSGRQTHPVKTKSPNELGIYDMSGNVWEMCNDWIDSYNGSTQTNPAGPISGITRVIRGGSWLNGVRNCRVSHRFGTLTGHRFLSNGFRLVMSAE